LEGEVADKVGKYVVIKGQPREVLQQLKDDAVLATNERARTSILEMEQLIELLDVFKVLLAISLLLFCIFVFIVLMLMFVFIGFLILILFIFIFYLILIVKGPPSRLF
jgi:uncharacterized membrane protein